MSKTPVLTLEGSPRLYAERISDDYWSIYTSPELTKRSYVGDVLGGGPTRNTRYKAISPSSCMITPEAAPGGYDRSLRLAAEILLDKEGER